jgi:hypothetical protein
MSAPSEEETLKSMSATEVKPSTDEGRRATGD